MSECVVRMDMPSCCHDCPFEADQWDYPICRVTRRSEGYRFDSRNNRMADCPIVCSLPEGHGRLVDADVLFDSIIKLYEKYGPKFGLMDMRVIFNNAPTIVPAEAERSET